MNGGPQTEAHTGVRNRSAETLIDNSAGTKPPGQRLQLTAAADCKARYTLTHDPVESFKSRQTNVLCCTAKQLLQNFPKYDPEPVAITGQLFVLPAPPRILFQTGSKIRNGCVGECNLLPDPVQ